jgi:carbonic anhydrase/acetyltransferase-like protein (isoleucine patch superfamily)
MSENKIIPYLDTIPEIDNSVFLAAGVKIIGNVKIGKNSSIWYNTVVRGDVNYITIGENTNVQDLSMLHVTANEFPLILGDDITIGHSVTLHGCELKDRTFIGMGATILDGAIVESNSMVAAGAVVRQGFTVPSGKLVAGVPAKIIRDLTEAEIENIKASAERYKKYAELSQK